MACTVLCCGHGNLVLTLLSGAISFFCVSVTLWIFVVTMSCILFLFFFLTWLCLSLFMLSVKRDRSFCKSDRLQNSRFYYHDNSSVQYLFLSLIINSEWCHIHRVCEQHHLIGSGYYMLYLYLFMLAFFFKLCFSLFMDCEWCHIYYSILGTNPWITLPVAVNIDI